MAATPVRGTDGRSASRHRWRDRTPPRGSSFFERENLRQMALVTGRLEGRDLGSAVAEIQAQLTTLKLPVGYTVGGRRAVRVAAAVVP